MLQQINVSTGHFAVILYIVFGSVLVSKSRGYKAFLFLAAAMFANALSYARQILSAYHVFDKMDYAFTPDLLLWAIFFAALYCLYPIEISRPGWLNPKRLFWFLSPALIMVAVYFIAERMDTDWYTFTSPAGIFSNISEFNVWIRVLFFSLSLLYSFLTFYILCSGVRSGKLSKWLVGYAVFFVINVVIYGFMAFYGTLEIVLAYKIYYLIFNLVITYCAVTYRAQRGARGAFMDNTGEHDAEISLPERLLTLMEEEKPWLDPEITQPKLAIMLYTNRTTLSGVIHDMGYRNFQEFINFYRIQEFKRIISDEKITNIQETFYRVGFRSKSTAFRCFSQFEKVTPYNYLQQRGLGSRSEFSSDVTRQHGT